MVTLYILNMHGLPNHMRYDVIRQCYIMVTLYILNMHGLPNHMRYDMIG